MMPLETSFANLQKDIGEYFNGHKEEISKKNLMLRVTQFWPRQAEFLARLLAGQPKVMAEVLVAHGHGTGR